MEAYRRKRGADGRERVEVRLRGPHLLNHPMYNRSTAFSREERRQLGLEGLLPDVVSSMEQQARRAYGNVVRRPDPLDRCMALAALHDRNEHLFHKVLVEHVEQLLPIVYAPTVGQACREYNRMSRRSRGLWVTPEHKGRMTEVLTNAPYEDVRLIVATDNERVLGLGDQGAGGMAIPVGKLALYVAAAGIHPAQTLPVSLDVGTDNQELLRDDLYVGWRHPRLRGEAYEAFVDEFVRAVKLRFPKAVLQWEDFTPANAYRLLERYRRELPSFNDDVQCGAAVAVAGLLAASRASGRDVGEERLVVVGGGAAGVGIAGLFQEALREKGIGEEDAQAAVALLDPEGLLVVAADDDASRILWTAELASSRGLRAGSPLLDVVKATRPTALVGVSGVPGLFAEEVVRTMASTVERPIVFPLSSPAEASEARPGDVIAWTAGRALVATGGPFDAAEAEGGDPRVAHCNSAFVFPGVALGALVCEAREVTDGMLAAAAGAVASRPSREDLAAGVFFPRLARLRAVTARVAEAVVGQAVSDGVARNPPPDPAEAVAAAMWEPAYPAIDVV
jgi:malate dehydrogenase (oxaloacetate-decarboxylating)